MATTSKKTAKIIAAARKNDVPTNSGLAAMAKLFSAAEPAQVKVHADGTIERLDRATMEQIGFFLQGKRAVDGVEIMEELNRDCIALMVSGGYIKPVENAQSRNVKNQMYFVTAKAAERFKLRPITSFGLPFKFVEA